MINDIGKLTLMLAISCIILYIIWKIICLPFIIAYNSWYCEWKWATYNVRINECRK